MTCLHSLKHDIVINKQALVVGLLSLLWLTVASQSAAQQEPPPVALKMEPPGFLEVTLQGKIIAQLNFKDPAGQGVVIYTDTGGVVKSSQFRNDVQ